MPPEPSPPREWAAPTSGPVDATVTIPGSKSLTNRYLVLAALADGPCLIRNALDSHDTQLMCGALRSLGARIHVRGRHAPGSVDLAIEPLTTGSPVEESTIDCGLAGTVMRFVPPVAALVSGTVKFDGSERARERPMTPLLEALRALGVEVWGGGLPAILRGVGAVRGRRLSVDASQSSQFLSGLLLTGSRFDEGLEVEHRGPDAAPSPEHVAMTVALLRDCGIAVDDSTTHRWVVAPGVPRAFDVTVEPDLSNAGPFLAAALVTGGRVRVPQWPAQSTQVGSRWAHLLALMGAEVHHAGGQLTATGGGTIRGGIFTDTSELAPTVAALCALGDRTSHLTGVGHLRGHESDRLQALATELGRLGGDVEVSQDALTIHPAPLRGALWHSYGDHRMATTGAVLGLRVPGVRVDDIACTAKTLPSFPALWDHLCASAAAGGQAPRGCHRRSRQHNRGAVKRDWDESDVRVRPAKGGSRPRTKQRPEHRQALTGRIITVDRGRYSAIVDEAEKTERMIVATRARELRRHAIVVGDQVDLVGDTSGGPGTLARIVRIRERSTSVRRSADDSDPSERVVAANVDQLMIVVAAAEPKPRYGFIDRALLAAYDAGIEPILVVTKTDVTAPQALLSHYEPAGVTLVLSCVREHGDQLPEEGVSLAVSPPALEQIRGLLTGKVTVLLGQSGVGKSTLINALTGAQRATGSVNATTGRGRHTSSSALALPVLSAPRTWVIDTPGLRSFGLAHVDPQRVVEAFPDIAAALASCPRDCSHTPDEPGCCLGAVGNLTRQTRERLVFFRRLYAAASAYRGTQPV